jgi:hypothetical protein
MKKILIVILLSMPLLTGMGYLDPYDRGYKDGYRNTPARSKDPQYVIGWNYGRSRQRDEKERAQQLKQEQQSPFWALKETPEPGSQNK